MTIQAEQARDVLGGTLYGPGGEKIGKIGQVFLDDQSGRPEWVTAATGFFGSNESFVPLADASVNGSDVKVAYDKDKIKGAPNVDPEGGHLSEAEERELYRYYGLPYSDAGTTTGTAGTTTDTGTTTGATGTGTSAGGGRDGGGVLEDVAGRTEGRDTSGPTTDDAMTRSEERLVPGVQPVEAGRARLRKYVTTETETQTVPVTQEKARVVTEPITEANREAAYAGPEISEAEHEVVLHADRPVVETEAVPVERVRLDTEAETREERVSGEVRKERIDVEDGPTDQGRGGR